MAILAMRPWRISHKVRCRSPTVNGSSRLPHLQRVTAITSVAELPGQVSKVSAGTRAQPAPLPYCPAQPSTQTEETISDPDGGHRPPQVGIDAVQQFDGGSTQRVQAIGGPGVAPKAWMRWATSSQINSGHGDDLIARTARRGTTVSAGSDGSAGYPGARVRAKSNSSCKILYL